MFRLFMILVGACLFIQAHALPCYITLVKDNCWSNYNVSVDVVDVSNETVMTTLIIPEGTSWVRNEIVCQPKQTVMLKATFSPVFWESDTGKIFYAQRYWSFPEITKPGVTALSMTICYAKDFAGLSLPPEANGHCVCDTKSIPPIDLESDK